MGKTHDDDQKSTTAGTADRRDFLKLAGVGTVAGGAALVAGTSADAAETSKSGKGYRDTAHIRTYYDSARF